MCISDDDDGLVVITQIELFIIGSCFVVFHLFITAKTKAHVRILYEVRGGGRRFPQ